MTKKSKLKKKGHSKYAVSFIKAHKIKIPNHPGEFCSQPWFSLVLRLNNPTGFVDAGTLYNAMVVQLSGVSFVSSLINIRLQTVKVWGPIPVTNVPLVVRFYDLFDDIAGSQPIGNLVAEEVTDYGDQVNRARVGYVYSSAQQQKSLLLASGSNDKILAISGGGSGSLAYFHLLWRPFPQALPPSFEEQFERVYIR